ncbi:hypothetical protein C8Q80DRAFT_1101519 [Daedaleopsis nitida]|nr:hypothetical protein C8Q80DRAFT_1101519 [Daedaleopsis nitida]
MPAKYSHVKKRPPMKKTTSSNSTASHTHQHHGHKHPSPHADRSISQTSNPVAKVERTIARIILLRFEQDIVRLFSTHLYYVALLHLPTFVLRCVTVGGPGWVAANSDCDQIKDFLRSTIAMDLRQAGDRVATKSVLWTYTALRHFAKSNGVEICQKSGVHSVRLLPHYDALKAHLHLLESNHPPAFAKPPHLGPMREGIRSLMEACQSKYGKGQDWQLRVREGYDRLCATLWRVAREFDVRGYGLILREKLTTKWCDCGCSTDHLGEVCESTVRMEEEESGIRSGKEREWDGRGSGISGWETEDEEDLWSVDIDFPTNEDGAHEDDMTVGELMTWRYLRAEREKEQGNSAFKKGDFAEAIERYKDAYSIEPEMPHYQLNLAAAYLKVQNYVEAEKACDVSLGLHKSVKGHWRRAQARKSQGRIQDALRDFRAVLQLQPSNSEAVAEITSLCPPNSLEPAAELTASASSSSSSSAQSSSSASSSTPQTHGQPQRQSWIPTPRSPKPLPFSRSTTDDRKLQISPVPITIDIPVDIDADGSLGGSSAGRPSQKKEGKKATSGKWTGRTVPHTFIYPCWERYMVRKLSD